MIIIWLPVNEALEKYKQYRHLITAMNYITPFNNVSEKEVKKFFNTDEAIEICSQTPSVGEIWATHPSYRYTGTSCPFFGRNVIFCKVSDENNVATELKNLMKMSSRISVPTPIKMIEHKEDVSELMEMKPNCKVAAVLVEEFIDSISIGRALIEERIDIEDLVKEVKEILLKMHTFCTHRDLKQSHIRICLNPEECKNLIFGFKSADELIIEKVSIIDVETARMKNEFSSNDIELSISNDLRQFIVSLTGYLSALEHPSELLKKILPMPLELRLERFGRLIEELFDNYQVIEPKLIIKHSKTLEFLLQKIDKLKQR